MLYRQEAAKTAHGVVAIRQKAGINATPSGSLVRRQIPRAQRPNWHAPWKLMRVISGHLGWVRSIAVEPGNKWFVTGAGDRTIKVERYLNFLFLKKIGFSNYKL